MNQEKRQRPYMVVFEPRNGGERFSISYENGNSFSAHWYGPSALSRRNRIVEEGVTKGRLSQLIADKSIPARGV